MPDYRGIIPDVISQDQQIEGNTRQLTQPVIYVATFGIGDTTPSVKNVNRWKGSGQVVTITDFKDGQEGQELQVLGDDNTTIQDYSNGSNIVMLGAADILIVSRTIYKFTLFDGLWIQH